MLAGWGRFAGLWVGAGVFLGLLLRLLSRLDEGHLLERVWGARSLPSSTSGRLAMFDDDVDEPSDSGREPLGGLDWVEVLVNHLLSRRPLETVDGLSLE